MCIMKEELKSQVFKWFSIFFSVCRASPREIKPVDTQFVFLVYFSQTDGKLSFHTQGSETENQCSGAYRETPLESNLNQELYSLTAGLMSPRAIPCSIVWGMF